MTHSPLLDEKGHLQDRTEAVSARPLVSHLIGFGAS